MEKVLLGSIFFFAMSCFGHPDRIRYIDPNMQKAYEEHCRANEGYTIPPEPRRPSKPLHSASIPIASSGSTSKSDESSEKTKSSASTTGDSKELPSEARSQKSIVSTSSSSSPSTVPLKIKHSVFFHSGWFWNEELGWLYISKATYPYFYSSVEKMWRPFVVLE